MKRGLFTVPHQPHQPHQPMHYETTDNRCYSYVGIIPSTSGSHQASSHHHQIYYTSSINVGKVTYNIHDPNQPSHVQPEVNTAKLVPISQAQVCTNRTSTESPPEQESWPCTASVLETPERRKWRDSNGGRLSVDSGLEVTDSMSSPPYVEQPTTAKKESPILKTPSTTFRSSYTNSHVHISSSPSPMRSFSIKNAFTSPIRRPRNGSPLKLTNPEKAIGIRFSGQEIVTSTPKPLATIQPKVPQPTNRFLELPPRESNEFIIPATTKNGFSNNDSSIEIARGTGRDSMLDISTDIDMMVMIETPSKSLRNHDDPSNFLSDLSPIPRASPLKGRLSMVPLTDGFIPEQPSGFLESSVFDIYDPLNENVLPQSTTTSNDSQAMPPPNSTARSPMKKPRMFSPEKPCLEVAKQPLKTLAKTKKDSDNKEAAQKNPEKEKPQKLFTGFTQKWIKMATGQSRDQLDVTKMAHNFMNRTRQQS